MLRPGCSFEEFEGTAVAPAQERGKLVLLQGAGGVEQEGGAVREVGSDLAAPNAERAFRGPSALRFGADVVVGKTLKAGQATERAARDVADDRIGILEQFGEPGRQPIAARGLNGRFPTEVPGQKGALPGIAGQNPGDGGGRLLLFGREPGLWLAEPVVQGAGGPPQASVQVAKIAGIGPAGLETGLDGRGINRVRANRLEQAVGSVGHVAVVAEAAGGGGTVSRVRLELRADCGVTLDARLIAFAVGRELVILAEVLMHRMAGKARESALLVTGGAGHAVELAARHAHHAVGPVAPFR